MCHCYKHRDKTTEFDPGRSYLWTRFAGTRGCSSDRSARNSAVLLSSSHVNLGWFSRSPCFSSPTSSYNLPTFFEVLSPSLLHLTNPFARYVQFNLQWLCLISRLCVSERSRDTPSPTTVVQITILPSLRCWPRLVPHQKILPTNLPPCQAFQEMDTILIRHDTHYRHGCRSEVWNIWPGRGKDENL